MDGVNGDVQQVFSLFAQKGALGIQASMVSQLMGGVPSGAQQSSLPEASLRTDALSELGIGTRLSLTV
jgi:hypothetical protein